jgi:hypothetical protein
MGIRYRLDRPIHFDPIDAPDYAETLQGEHWYRYEDVKYAAPLDEFDEPMGEGDLHLHLRAYRIDKHTPCGVWAAGRWISRDARKRFACPTRMEALESYIARKTGQARILRAKLNKAESLLNLAIGLKEEANK